MANNTLSEIELLRIVSREEFERLSGLDFDTFTRNYPRKVVHLSPRRVGVRVRDALMLDQTADPIA